MNAINIARNANIAPVGNIIAGAALLKSGFEPIVSQAKPAAQSAVEAAPAPQGKLTLARVRRMVLASYMASDASSAFRKFPYAASNTDFTAFGFSNETSKTLNKALRTGARGLADDAGYCAWVDSLPMDVAPTLRAYIESVLHDRAPLAKLIVNAFAGFEKIAAA